MIDIQAIKQRFPKIERFVNEVLEELRATDGSWHSEAINWADLRCAEVQYIITEHDEHYMAIIEEASPACPSLCTAVSARLKSAGFENVYVQTEW